MPRASRYNDQFGDVSFSCYSKATQGAQNVYPNDFKPAFANDSQCMRCHFGHNG